MLSKITPIALLGSASAFESSNINIQARPDRELIREMVSPKPRVRAGDCTDGGFAVTRLKKGPANIPEVMKSGSKWSDTEWTGKDVLYKPGYPDSATETLWGNNYNNGIWTYESWQTVTGYTTATLFKDNTATYKEPRQGGAGTCYFISAISTAAEWPKLITDMFVTGTDMSGPNAGIIGVKFFIRGKPWVVTIDDKLYWYTSGGSKYLKFNQPDSTNNIMWAPILEKAWAKVKGNYDATFGGFVVSGLRSITGAPVFTYKTSDIGTSSGLSLDATFDLLKAANDANYPMGAGTTGGSDTNRNDCGIATGHAYSILETFEMNDNGTMKDMLLMRNPWGTTDYSGPWHHGDAAWTSALKTQVPFGLDPTTSHNDGIFVMPMSTFGQTANSYNCIYNYEIAHYRDGEGYSGDWYDAENMDEAFHNYYITVPKYDGALYFTVETYYQDIIPNECTTGSVTFSNGSSATLSNPLLDYEVWKDGASSYTAYKYVSDQFSYPILLTTYSAGDVFKVVVGYKWFNSPAKDYTVKIYSKQSLQVKNASGATNIKHMDGQEPSGFTSSTYRGMGASSGGTTTAPVEVQPQSIFDLFAEAEWDFFAFITICFAYPEICFNPANWF